MSVVAFARILSCCALIAATAAAAQPSPVMTKPIEAMPSAPSICIDQMETDPDYDDPDPTPVSATIDGGCTASLDPIST